MYKFFLLLLLSCCVFQPLQAQKLKPKNLLITQGEQTYLVHKSTQEITLNREAFSIEYLNKQYGEEKGQFYAAQVLVTEDMSMEENNYQSKSFDEIPFLSLGTGMAAHSNQMQLFPYLTNGGHQYLFYKTPEEFRVKYLGNQGKWLRLQWTLAGVNIDGKEISWKDYPYQQVMIYFVLDHNQNRVLDAKEHHLIRITFAE